MVRKRVFNEKSQQVAQSGDDADSASDKSRRQRTAPGANLWKVYALSAFLVGVIVVAIVVFYHLHGNYTHVQDVTKKAELPLASIPNAYDEVSLHGYVADIPVDG